jgi:hypothetical protein
MLLKKFTAKRLLEQLSPEGREWPLKDLHFYRAAHKTRSEHQVWQEGVHPKAAIGDDMMLQKLDYVHNHPIQRRLGRRARTLAVLVGPRMVPGRGTGTAMRPVAQEPRDRVWPHLPPTARLARQCVIKQEFRHESKAKSAHQGQTNTCALACSLFFRS